MKKLQHNLLVQPKKVSPPRLTDTTGDKIWKYYFHKNSCRLTEKEEQIRIRVKKAWDLMASFKSPRNVVKVICKDYDISERQAYNDIRMAKLIFQDPFEGDRQAHRALVNEWINRVIKKAYKDGDLMTVQNLIGRYIDNNDLKGEENPLADLIKNFKPIQVVFTTDEQTLKKQADELMEGVEDVAFEVIEHED
ncbi:MAG: hypothetical protein AAF363_18705 [Bacteroidota bacterium]